MENVCKTNAHACPCPKPNCPNHGKCCDCVANHRAVGNVPYCLAENVEKMKNS